MPGAEKSKPPNTQIAQTLLSSSAKKKLLLLRQIVLRSFLKHFFFSEVETKFSFALLVRARKETFEEIIFWVV